MGTTWETGIASAWRPFTRNGTPASITRNVTAGRKCVGIRVKSGQMASLKRWSWRSPATSFGPTTSIGPSVRPKTFSTRNGSEATWSRCECVTMIDRTLDCSSRVSDCVSAPASRDTVPSSRNEVCRCQGVEPPYAPRTRIRTTTEF